MTAAAGSTRTAGRAGAVLTSLRVAVALHGLSILVQAVTAGQMIGGADMRGLHGTGAAAVHVLGLVQLVLAVVYWRAGRGPGWPAAASLVLFLLGFGQSMTGGMGAAATHVPLGLLTFGVAVAILVVVFRPVRAS
ncbi:hypothetical protein C1I98_15585 [Spongiactinospora gelatinilytica]|uniref:Integral membrane protein n=1 Tax=Spongiactinospora gelatinilytica TaxID=2666298 RepID=A0A2W2G693_9ACTN|nr:hypothetical protein [Spongiactinospora gelatinilytica]PZG45426.1 hypothetical protein C1I98_15585 [Spongiactinospora gelatinilytica]